MKRKILLFTLTVIAIICITAVTVSAEEYSGKCGDNLTWSYDTNTFIFKITGTGDMYTNRELYAPSWDQVNRNVKSVIIGEGITSIGSYAFSNFSQITNIVIPDSVTYIGDSAFMGCYKLTSVFIPQKVSYVNGSAFDYCESLSSITVDSNNRYFSNDEFGVIFSKDKSALIRYPQANPRSRYNIPSTVTSIDDKAFYGCTYLTDITLPSGVTSIGNSSFSYCQRLTGIIIPESVTSIGNSAFSYCYALSSIAIPGRVNHIGTSVFFNCYNLSSITVDESNRNYASDEFGALFSKNKSTLIQYPVGNSRTEYIIPDGVTTINNSAFSSSIYLKRVVMPNSITYIDKEAFKSCGNLSSVVFSDKTNYIGGMAFSGCYSLKDITLPDSLVSIDNAAFQNCSGLTSIVIPKNVTSIHNSAFIGCTGLSSITVAPESKTYSSEDGVLFDKNKTTLVRYPEGSTRTNYTVPNSVNLIGVYAFYSCNNLVSVVISDNVTFIDIYAFISCKKLTRVIIPKSVSHIDNYTFVYSPEVTVYGYAGSVAEAHAKSRNIPFVLLPFGDTDGNGVVNALDGVKLARYLAGWNRCEISESVLLDFNTDDQIDTVDLLILLRHIAGWKGYETLFEI